MESPEGFLKKFQADSRKELQDNSWRNPKTTERTPGLIPERPSGEKICQSNSARAVLESP